MPAVISFKAITLYSLFAILVFGTINNIYVSFFSIRRLDRYFSKKNNPDWESNSPFDSFYRLHKYSFLYSFGILLQPCLHMGQLRPGSSRKILQHWPILIAQRFFNKLFVASTLMDVYMFPFALTRISVSQYNGR
jgi:hypothetical protein